MMEFVSQHERLCRRVMHMNEQSAAVEDVSLPAGAMATVPCLQLALPIARTALQVHLTTRQSYGMAGCQEST